MRASDRLDVEAATSGVPFAEGGVVRRPAQPRRGVWLRPLIVAAAGLFLLGVGGLTASHFVHSEQPWSQVSCLNSTCTAGMAMDSRMDGHASPGNGPAMQDRAASPPVVAPSGPRSRRSPLARFLRALRQDLPRR